MTSQMTGEPFRNMVEYWRPVLPHLFESGEGSIYVHTIINFSILQIFNLMIEIKYTPT